MQDQLTDSFEFNLASLRPAPAGVGQASFYYRAGQVSKERAVRTWQIVAGCTVALMLVTVGICGWRIADAETRIAEAEAKRAPVTANVVPVELPQPTLPPSASADEDLRPYAPPMTPHQPESEPTPNEVNNALATRRNILTAGVSYLDAQAQHGTQK